MAASRLESAEQLLRTFIPSDADGQAPTTYLWARTIQLRGTRMRCKSSADSVAARCPQRQPALYLEIGAYSQ